MNMQPKKKFRPEIEGLRAVAALLVAVYHIWFGRVSGGVDVFFVVSGFLITTSLLSKVRKSGTVNFFDFIFTLLKRLMPSAFFILLSVLVLSYWLMPEVRWIQTIKEIFASALYYENWQLALTATDYLDHTNEKSPVQHFWAMSIQGQFYIIWFCIIWIALVISRKLKSDIKQPLLIILMMLFIVSFSYSIYLTAVNQPWAYFDTRTRVWEFALGGILCLTLTAIRLPQRVAIVLGWFGLFMLLICGMVLNVSTLFPGFIALWPTLAAVCILIAAENGTKLGVERLLGARWMVKLGSLSYGFYLWHWVILSFYYIVMDRKDVPLIDGLIIIGLSLLLSWIVTTVIEQPIRTFKPKNDLQLGMLLVAIALPVLLLNGLWKAQTLATEKSSRQLVGSDQYPGARAFDMKSVEARDYLPTDANIKTDKAKPYIDGCHVGADDPQVKVCEYGQVKNYDYTVAIVGGSHATHWFPAVESFADKENIRLLNITKSGCRLSSERKEQPSCDEWNEHVIDKVAEQQPDLVMATAEISAFNVTEVPVGYIDQFNQLKAHGIDVFAVRDTPYFHVDVPTCIQKYGSDSMKCTVPKDEVVPQETDWSKVEHPPTNVYFFDYTDHICPDNPCRPVIGNVVGYVDKGHMSKSFTKTLSPYVERDMMPLLERIKKKRISK